MLKHIPEVTLATHLSLVAVACDIVGTDAYTGSISLPSRISLVQRPTGTYSAVLTQADQTAAALAVRFGAVDTSVVPSAGTSWVVTYTVDLG